MISVKPLEIKEQAPTWGMKIPNSIKPLAWTLIICAAWVWGNYLNETAFSRDRMFHTMAFLFGTERPTEPLWVIIAPVIGLIFGDQSFEAASMLTLCMITIGLMMHRLPMGLCTTLIFSPGVAYFLTNALRQGFAVGVFLLLLSQFKVKRNPIIKHPFRWSWVLLATMLCSLIHNSIVIGGVYIIASMLVIEHSTRGHRSQNIQAGLLLISLAIFPLSMKIGGTALIILSIQTSILLLSFLYAPFRSAWAPLLSVYTTICISGFLFTGTGLRIVIMAGILAPLISKKPGKWLALAGCVLYPLVQYGGFAIEVDEEAADAATGA